MSLQQFFTLAQAPMPCVVVQCNYKEAKWYGKWHFLGAIPAGIAKGPYETEADACAAVESVGWTRRPQTEKMSGPHFDRPK